MRTPTKPSSSVKAFTLVELLVVMSAVAILAAIASTALGYNQPGSDRAICAFNQRQLIQGWQMYADDYAGSLMANAGVSSGLITWVKGTMDFSGANNDNFNTAYLTDPRYALMGYYVKSPSYFRCPADLAAVVRSGLPTPRVRSYSMNGFVGAPAPGPSPGFQAMSQASQVPQPERTFVLLDEHPDSINDGAFYVDMVGTGAGTRFLDVPGAFHSAGANLAMADGHVEYWQWADSRSMPPIRFVPSSGLQSPNNPDVLRLQKMTTYRP